MSIPLLVDENQSPRLVLRLWDVGIEAVHTSTVEHLGVGATDEEIVRYAERLGLTIVTADTDFGRIILRNQMNKPSVILFGDRLDRSQDDLGKARLLASICAEYQESIEAGCLIVMAGVVRVTLNHVA